MTKYIAFHAKAMENGLIQELGRHLEAIPLKTAKNHTPTEPKNRQSIRPRVSQGVRLWALKVALIALAIQVLMPISMALAANSNISGNMLGLCTQFGIQSKFVDLGENPEGKQAAKAPWECPICQLQIGGDAPKTQVFAFAVFGLEKDNAGTNLNNVAVYKYYKDPNSPRAPPGA